MDENEIPKTGGGVSYAQTHRIQAKTIGSTPRTHGHVGGWHKFQVNINVPVKSVTYP